MKTRASGAWAVLLLAAPVHAETFDDAVTGVSLALADGWHVMNDPVLFDETYGFAVYAPAATEEARAHADHERDAIARVAVVLDHRAELDERIAEKIALYRDLALARTDIKVGRHQAVLLTGLPGTKPYSVVFLRVGDRVYEIGLWSNDGDVDTLGRAVLEGLTFGAPTRTVESLGLQPADEAAYNQPPEAQAIANRVAAGERRAVKAALASQRAFGADEDKEGRDAMQAASCGFTAPASLDWQLQWDNSNTFYNGTYYSMQSQPGFSAMSGNYGSWWGTNYHVGLCYLNQSNQYYANDWPAQHWANAYAAFSGYVEWAGWGTDGFYTLGNYVVIRDGAYRNVTAHLSGIARGVHWGAYVNGYWKVIGWAGSTGGPWDPHLHARVSWSESLTANGQPYGGQSVRPRRLRCYTCNSPDVTTAAGAKYYNSFSHGRWMRH